MRCSHKITVRQIEELFRRDAVARRRSGDGSPAQIVEPAGRDIGNSNQMRSLLFFHRWEPMIPGNTTTTGSVTSAASPPRLRRRAASPADFFGQDSVLANRRARL